MEDKRPNSEGRARAIYRVTIGGSVCNFLLLLFKFVAGILGGSAAMLADAVHSLSDFVTDVVVILFVRISSKPCDADHDFGHGKYETLASVFIGLMLACVGVGILWSGAEKIIDVCRGQVLEQPGMIAFVAALLSIVVKEVLYQWTARVGRRVVSNVKGRFTVHAHMHVNCTISTNAACTQIVRIGHVRFFKYSVLDEFFIRGW